MLWRGSAALLVALGLTAAAPAQDEMTLRLGDLPGVRANVDDGDDTTVPVWRYGFRGYYGGYRGFYGGYRGFYGGYRGFYGYGGYRNFYGGFYPRYYGYGYGGFYRPYYASYYYPSYYGGFGYGYPSYYYSSYYASPFAYSYYPCTVTTVTNGFSSQLGSYPRMDPADPPADQEQPAQPAQPMPQDDGTYRYDGGPPRPVPMPKADQNMAPSRLPSRPTVPLDGRAVSLPPEGGKTKFAYPAYGEDREPTRFATERKAPPTRSTFRTAQR